jgi:hypothetical protein
LRFFPAHQRDAIAVTTGSWWQLFVLRAALALLLLTAAQASSAAPFRLLLLARSLDSVGLSEDEKRNLLHHEQRESAAMPFGGVGRQVMPTHSATAWLPLEVRAHAVRVESPNAGAGPVRVDGGTEGLGATDLAGNPVGYFVTFLHVLVSDAALGVLPAAPADVLSGARCARFFAAGL